jgi:GNAT superfamily N-acetyltransferase
MNRKNTMPHVKFIKHAKLTFIQKLKIVLLKRQKWRKNIISQLFWLQKNFLQMDIHLLLYIKHKLIGYLSIQGELVIDQKKDIFGIGSVIVHQNYRKHGYSKLMISEAIKYFNQKNVFIILNMILESIQIDIV